MDFFDKFSLNLMAAIVVLFIAWVTAYFLVAWFRYHVYTEPLVLRILEAQRIEREQQSQWAQPNTTPSENA